MGEKKAVQPAEDNSEVVNNPPKQPKGKILDTSGVVGDLQKASDEKDAALNLATLEGAENFTDNYYLIQILDSIKGLASSTVYKGWTSLSQTESGRNPSFLKAYFQGWDKFTSMTTTQASLLVPYFRLSVVQRDKKNARWSEISAEYDVLLQGTYAGSQNPNSALSEQYNEPTLGLKDFSFKKEAHMDKGKRASTTATIKFFGNNLSIFQRSPYKEMLARVNTNFGMKIVVGWSVSDRAAQEHFPPGFKQTIRAARTVLYMQTTRNEFDFNQDGTFTVTLTCAGSTDDFIREFDLLGPMEGLRALTAAARQAEANITNPGNKKTDGEDEKLNSVDESKLNDPEKRISTDENLSIDKIEEVLTDSTKAAVANNDDLTQEQKDKFVRESVEAGLAEAKRSYNGDSPEYFTKSDLADRFNKLVTQEAIAVQKQRSQERMSRIQFLLYKNKYIRYVKVGKEEFQKNAGATLAAIPGRQKLLKAQLKAIEAEMDFYKKLYGEFDDDGNRVSDGLLLAGEDGLADNVTLGNMLASGATLGMYNVKIGSETMDSMEAENNREQIKFTNRQGKSVNLDEALEERGMLLGSAGFTGIFNLNYGSRQEEALENINKAKAELKELEASDPTSAEATQLRILTNIAMQKYTSEVAEHYSAIPDMLGADKLVEAAEFEQRQTSIEMDFWLSLRREQALEQLAALEKSIADGTPPPEPTVLGVVEGTNSEKAEVSETSTGEIDPLSEENTRTHYISYFFLGDLINVLYEMAVLDGRSAAMPYMLIGSMVYNQDLVAASKTYRNVKQQQNGSFQRKMIEMAQIPISVKRFNAFFHRHYVQKLYNRVNLSVFLKDVFSILVRPIFSGEAFGLKLRKPTFNHINFTSGEMTMPAYQKMSGIPRANMSSISPSTFYKPENTTQAKGYIMVTSNLVHQANGNGNFARDFQLNIPHYYLGADRGVIKNVNFTAVRNKKDEADRVVKASTPQSDGTDPQGPGGIGLKVLKTPYDVFVTTIGNPMMSPGGTFYLLPTVPGKNNAVAARELGLGGYYTTIHIEGHLSEGGTYETMANARNTLNQFPQGKASNEKDNKTNESKEIDPKSKVGEND